MGLSDLLRALEAEADARIQETLGRAEAEASRLRQESRAEWSRRRAAETGAREVQLRASAAREIEKTRRDGTRHLLEARATTLERIRSRVIARLRARAQDPALLPLLRRDLGRGLDYLGDGAVTVEAAGPLMEALRGAMEDRRDLQLEPAPAGRAGLLLRSWDRSVTVDATLESRLDQAWPRLAIELARRLEAAP